LLLLHLPSPFERVGPLLQARLQEEEIKSAVLASIQSLLCPMSPPPKEQPPAQAPEEDGGQPSLASSSSSSSTTLKRPLAPKAASSPSKKQTKWTPEEDALIVELRGRGDKWEDISKSLPGRSALSCRLHYQNYLERRPEWDEEKKNLLARLYERFVLLPPPCSGGVAVVAAVGGGPGVRC